MDELIHGDCLDVMRGMDAGSVDLIMTSPPYADARKHTYGGVKPDQYVEWFLPRAAEMQRILKPSGSFVLNIKEKVVDGQRHTYVLKLILAMQEELGWRWIEEYIWHKKSSMPGRFPKRMRDAWERILHFSNDTDFKIRHDAVKTLPKESTIKRMRNLRPHELTRVDSSTGSGFGKNFGKDCWLETALPDNVLHLAGETGNVGHSAAFPVRLPEFFIKLFTDADDVVLDPFCGSGTTMAAAQSLGRQWIGIDKDQSSIDISRKRLAQTQPALIPA